MYKLKNTEYCFKVCKIQDKKYVTQTIKQYIAHENLGLCKTQR